MKNPESFCFQSFMLIFTLKVFPSLWFLCFSPQRKYRFNAARATDHNSIGNNANNDKTEVKQVLVDVENKSQIIKMMYSLYKNNFLFLWDVILV